MQKWGKRFLSDFSCWPKEGCSTSALSCWATGKDSEMLGKAQLSPFPFHFFPIFSVSTNHPDHTTGAASSLFALWASSAPSLHSPVFSSKNIYWTHYFSLAVYKLPETCQYTVACLLSDRFCVPRTGAQLGSATCSTLRTCSQMPAGLQPQQEAPLRRNPLPAHSAAFWSSLPCRSVIRLFHTYCLLGTRHL